MDLSKLPSELLQHIGEYLESQDLSSFSLLSRRLHWRLFYPLFDRAQEKGSDLRQRGDKCLVSLFFHAVKHDSINIAQYLSDSADRINLNESIHNFYNNAAHDDFLWRFPLSFLPQDFTLLHFALLADAPRVAVHLMKNGADISQEVEDYPDLTPLYMTLPRSLSRRQIEFDSALRIACSYALPRTVAFLLTSGANANTTNSYGIAAIHSAVMRRRPWREFRLINHLLSHQYGHGDSRWESMSLQTVSTLLDFGANIHLRSRNSRNHKCDTSCWRSIDCDHQGQTALHFASANSIPAIVSLLLDAGADPKLPDAQGYTALYCALVQGHKDVACRILQRCDDTINPIVHTQERTTALHVACQFSFTDMVYELLTRGAYANVIDSYGRTPLYDALKSTRLDREEELFVTIKYLVNFRADPDTTAYHPTPRQIAETHPSLRVRDMFSAPQQWARIRPARPILSKQSEIYAPNSPGNIYFSGAKRKAKSPKLLHDPVPRQMGSNLEDSICAPHHTTHLAKSLEASVKNSYSDKTAALQEPFPSLITERERNPTHCAAPVAGIWSEIGTAQMIRDLKLRALPAKPVQRPQQPVEAFPVLHSPA